jgi:hypothetical protein
MSASRVMNPAVLEFAVEMISNDFGSLDDLPEELADSVANQYYSILQNLRDLDRGAVGSNLMAALEKQAGLQANFTYLPKKIADMREMRDTGRTDLFHYWTTYLLDHLKYGIKDIERKSAVRRSIERKFRKPDEIPRLYRLIRERVNTNKASQENSAAEARAKALNAIAKAKTTH